MTTDDGKMNEANRRKCHIGFLHSNGTIFVVWRKVPPLDECVYAIPTVYVLYIEFTRFPVKKKRISSIDLMEDSICCQYRVRIAVVSLSSDIATAHITQK